MVSRCLSATGIRFSVILYPPRELGPPHGRLTGRRPDPDGVSAFRTHELRPGWAPSIPRGRRCSSRPMATSGRRLPLRSGQSLHPAPASITAGPALNEESTRVQAIRPSGLPQPVAARMERAALGLTPRASHPADQEPDDARRGGDRPSSTDLELPAQLTFSVDLQSGSSLNACDLASHVAKVIVGVLPARTVVLRKAIIAAPILRSITGPGDLHAARSRDRRSSIVLI